MCIGIKVNKTLIGNLMILLSDRCKPLYHTKLLKLLFLIDEESVLRTGVPITWLNYKAWQLGPVNEDVFLSKFTGFNKFDKYVSFHHAGDGSCVIKPISVFDDSEFCDLDIEIINDVIAKYGNKSCRELVELTHRRGSIYDETKKKYGIEFSGNNRTSDIEINFRDLLDSCSKKAAYQYALENMQSKILLNV